MESPHILAGLFRANENGCRVSGSKNGEGGGVKVSQKDGVKERREASAREGWKGGVLEERRFCRTTSK